MVRYFNAYILFPMLEKVAKRDIFSKLKEVKRFENLPRTDQKKIQQEELWKTLSFCSHEIPYYKELFKKHSFNPDKVKEDVRYLEDLPLLTKEIIRENVDRLKTSKAIHPRKTGGSTGQSVFFYYDNEGLDWTSAINLQAYDMAHNFRHRKDCHICSEIGVVPPHLKGKIFDWIKLFSQNRKRLMISSFSDEDLKRTHLNLKRIQPYLLQGHPSSAYAISQYIKSKDLKPRRYCSIFEPSGEMLTEKTVNSIEKYLGCKVVNRYGNAEFGVVAHSRLHDSPSKLKVFDRAFYVQNNPKNELIVTGLTNFGMPLIRYNTGDLASVSEEKEGTYISEIKGRVHDEVIISGEPYATHFIMDYLDHKVKGIREFQIVLQDSKEPLLTLVSEDGRDNERIKRELLKRWPEGLDIKFVALKEMRRVGWRQKFRHLINDRRE